MEGGIEGRKRKFITTEPLSKPGEVSEEFVWNAVRNAFSDRNCIAYWHYPIFSKVGEHRKEPDILIVDRDLGLIIIEVKGLAIDQITEINGHCWEIKDFYDYPYENPYQQAENQLWALLGYCNIEPSLRAKVIGKAIVALPRITEKQWQEKGFDQLPSSPPIIFKDNLGKVGLLKKISEASLAASGVILDDDQWELLLAVVGGTPVLRKPPRQAISNKKTRSGIIAKQREDLYSLDLQQEHIGKTIPPGPQRIRGIGGSGKTVLLCQKAVRMHLKYPDWDIALVFFTQSLYDQIIDQIDHWMRRFTNGELKYSPTNHKLRVLHAWGGRYRAGLYSTICDAHGIKPLTSNDSELRDPIERLADLCKRFLEENEIHPIFDAILIDEGQELVVDDKLKFENKQPIYWLAYQALRPVDPSHPEQRRLIWAYDEAQNLTNLKTPSAKELFGENLSKLVSGQYPGGIRKSEILYRCFRTPGQIITAAHAISMGLLRPDGMISGYTTQRDWNNIGYEVIKGNFLPGQKITLRRPPENSPNRVPEMLDESILDFNVFKSRQEELKALAESIQYNLKQDYLNPSRDILVIVLGSHKTNFRLLQINVAEYLIEQGINVYIPSAPDYNILKFNKMQAKRNVFWRDGAITVSGIYHAKGNKAYMVYVVGLDNVAMDESNANLRNQLFVALSRSMGWVKLSGVGEFPLFEEMRQVINSGNTLTFDFKRPPVHGSSEEDLSLDVETTDFGEQPLVLDRKEPVSQKREGSLLSKIWPFKK